MIKIGICDDEIEFCKLLAGYLTKYENKEQIKCEIEIFANGKQYLNYLKDNPPLDLLFLDIELGEYSGVDIGKKIRSSLENEITQIIYVSSKTQYAMELFQVRPMSFLVKPINERSVNDIMNQYRLLYNNQKNYFIYSAAKQTHRVLEENIIYFQSRGRKIILVTNYGKIEFYGKIADVATRLNPNKFCIVHKSYIVNMNCVLQYNGDGMIMVNQQWIPISQSMKSHVDEKILLRELMERRII